MRDFGSEKTKMSIGVIEMQKTAVSLTAVDLNSSVTLIPAVDFNCRNIQYKYA